MPDPEPTTQELRVLQTKREQGERAAADEASTEADERTHRRRAEKASYLEQKLAEQEHADES